MTKAVKNNDEGRKEGSRFFEHINEFDISVELFVFGLSHCHF